MTHFDEAVALAPQADGSFLGHTHPAYANMVGPFGGMIAAQVLNAVLQHPQRLGEPVSATVNFCAPLADGAFVAVARPVRTNRSTQHWIAELRQDEATVVSATVFTAVRRDSWGGDEHAMPAVPMPQDVPRATGRSPVQWVHAYEMRFVEGAPTLAFDGAEHSDSRTRLWVREDPPRPLDFASLMARCDVFFPRLWRRRAALVPVGTVSMTVYFHADAARLQAIGEDYLLAQAQGQAFHRGYFDQTAQLWTRGAQLVATTHQIVYFRG